MDHIREGKRLLAELIDRLIGEALEGGIDAADITDMLQSTEVSLRLSKALTSQRRPKGEDEE